MPPIDDQLGLPFIDAALHDAARDVLLIVPDRHGTFVEPERGTRVIPLAAFLDHVRALATLEDPDIIVDEDAALISAAHVLAGESKRSLRLARDLAGLSRMLRHAAVDPSSVGGALGRRPGGREGGLAPLFARVLEVRERLEAAHLVDGADALARGVDVVQRGVLPPFLKRFARIIVRHVVDPTDLELEALIAVARAGVPVLFVLPIDPRGRGRTSSTTWIATRIEACHDVPALDLQFEEMRGRGAVSAFVDAWYGSAVQSPVLTADLPVRVEILADAASEARRIAGVVGHWWRTGGAATRIAVAFRTLDAHAERVVDAIRDHGIPVARRDGRPLLELPAGQALADLFGLARDGMPRERLLSLLSQPIFRRHRPTVEVGRIARTLRRAAARSDVEDSTTPHGGYRHRLTRMADALDDGDPLLEEISRALAAIEEVSMAIGPLPHRAPIFEFLVSARRMLDEHIGGEDDEESGWSAVDALLSRLMRAHGRVALPHASDVELSPFTRFLERALKDERIPLRAPTGSSVEVVALASLFGRELDYVVIGDCVHGKLPRAERGDPLLSDSDKALVNQALGARALRLVDEDVFEPAPVSPRIAPELLAFAGAIASASRGLLLTAAARDARGREVAPSDFLEEALIALGAAPDASSAGMPFDEDVHPRVRTVALARAIVDGSLPDDVDVDAAMITRVEHACTMSRERSRFFLRPGEVSVVEASSPFAFAVDQERISREFGHLLGLTSERPLTPTRLEALAACPYRGFVEHILRVDTAREAGQDADARVLGRLAHKALEIFFKERKEQGVSATRMTRDDELRLDALVDENAAPLRDGKETGHLAALDANVRWLKRSLRRTVVFLAQNPPYPGAEPMAFELSFGIQHRQRDSTDEESLAAVPITVGDRELFLGGEIDRVDLVRDSDGRVNARVVVDYKSATAAAVEKKLHPKDLFTKHFQIPIYLRLLDHHAKRKHADFAGYLVSLRDGVSSPVIGEEVDLRRRVIDDKNERGLAKGIGRVILPILDGAIAPIENWGCPYCRVARICRHDDVASETLHESVRNSADDDAFATDEDHDGGTP
jgi:hypothetical protein